MLLSTHFTLEELTASDTAARKGWDNQPPPDILDRMRDTLAPGLEQVRHALGDTPIHITSGYRCPKLNQAVGSKPTSAHLWGYAADFICPRVGYPIAVTKRLADSGIEFDQLIHEFGRWTHISFDPRMRGQVLTIDRQGTRTGILVVRP
jgi:zinc D-Ala-D-Ala carboxypeptidase